MRNFYSGISNDKTQFLINMNWYTDNDVEACFRLSKNFHGYEIATSVVWMLIGICLLFIGKYVIGKAKYCWGKYKEDWRSDYDMDAVGLGVLIVGGIVIILCQTFDIVTCITFPEKVIIEELQSVYSSLK